MGIAKTKRDGRQLVSKTLNWNLEIINSVNHIHSHAALSEAGPNCAFDCRGWGSFVEDPFGEKDCIAGVEERWTAGLCGFVSLRG